MNKALKKIKENFLLKIIVSLSLFIFSIIIVYSIFFITVKKNTMHGALIDMGVILTKVLAQGSRIGTFSGSKTLLEKELKNIFQHDDLIRANVYDASGKLLSSHSRSSRNTGNKPASEEIKINPEQYAGLSSKNSYYVEENDETMEFWAPVFPDSSFDTMDSYYYDTKEIAATGLPTGYVSVIMTKDNLKKKISSLIFVNVLINVILIMVISMVIYFFTNHAQIPFEKLMRGIKTLEMGDEPEPVDITSSDEIGKLAKSFNDMSRILMERERVRKTIKKDMEAALELKNDELLDLNNRLNIEVNEHRVTLTKLFKSKEDYKKILSTIEDRYLETQKQKKNELKEQEDKRIKSIRTLAGGIAHEYNNLLHSIGLNHSLLIKDLEHQRKYRECLDSIDLCLVKAKKLTNKFLSFGRGGKFEAKPIIMNDILKKTSKMFVESREDIEIIEDFQSNIHKIEADQNQIEQSFLNILLNAGQAMPTGGNIIIETKNVTLDKEFASQYENEAGDYVCCSITDTGTGMTTETMNRMFDPFFTTRDMSEGTGKGLGLASVYGTINNHKGIITASSKIDQGTTFNIFFHAIKEYVPQKRREVFKTNVDDRKITVMLVDDEPIILELGKEILESYDFNTYVAKNGLEAVNLYKDKTHEIDIIVLDMIMPVMDGSEAYLKLKEINEKVVVLLSSGYQLDMKVQAILDQGCNGFIQKPYQMGELNAKIRAMLE